VQLLCQPFNIRYPLLLLNIRHYVLLTAIPPVLSERKKIQVMRLNLTVMRKFTRVAFKKADHTAKSYRSITFLVLYSDNICNGFVHFIFNLGLSLVLHFCLKLLNSFTRIVNCGI